MGVQWLTPCPSNAGDMGRIPGWGSSTYCMAKKKKKKIHKDFINSKKKNYVTYIRVDRPVE